MITAPCTPHESRDTVIRYQRHGHYEYLYYKFVFKYAIFPPVVRFTDIRKRSPLDLSFSCAVRKQDAEKRSPTCRRRHPAPLRDTCCRAKNSPPRIRRPTFSGRLSPELDRSSTHPTDRPTRRCARKSPIVHFRKKCLAARSTGTPRKNRDGRGSEGARTSCGCAFSWSCGV